jgi:undecaprenyl-diphosphatase
MNLDTFIGAVLLGIIEGATEYLPVSSTGHLIIFVDLLGFTGPPGKVFEVFIQLGAVLAVCLLYWRKILDVVLGLRRQPREQHFAMAVILAFLPAAVIGVILHDFIKEVLFSPLVVAIALIVGGIAIILIEKYKPDPKVYSIDRFGYKLALQIGFIQCVAMIPGVSRSAATILGAMLLGVDRRTATEFSFFLAMPTLLGAAVYDLYKNRAGITDEGGLALAVGFITAFITALLVVRWLVAFISRHNFTPFAWYRMALGVFMLGLLALR